MSATPGHGTARRLAVTRGTFSTKEALTRAVERLGAASVPADSITVTLQGGPGRRPARTIAVEDEGGALRGGMIGAACGAAIGVLIVIAALAGVLGEPGAEPFAITTLVGAARAIMAAAAAGVPLGVILGMGRWKGRSVIDAAELDGANAVVSVESDELADLAFRILRESGAMTVTKEKGPAT